MNVSSTTPGESPTNGLGPSCPTTSNPARTIAISLVGLFTLFFSVSSARSNVADIAASNVENAPSRTTLRFAPIVKRTLAYDRFPIAPSSAIGSVDEARVVPGRVLVRGWIVTQDRKIAPHVFAIVDGHYRYDITSAYGSPRPDVTVYLNQADLLDCGIGTALSTAGLSKGPHQITFAILLRQNKALYPIANSTSFQIS